MERAKQYKVSPAPIDTTTPATDPLSPNLDDGKLFHARSPKSPGVKNFMDKRQSKDSSKLSPDSPRRAFSPRIGAMSCPSECKSGGIVFGGERKVRLSAFEIADREALAPLDLGKDGTIDIDDLKAAAKMYGAAQECKAIPFDAFPAAVHDTLKIFDMDGDNTIDPKELAAAGQLYSEAKTSQKRLFTTTIVMGFVSILVLCAMLGVTVLAVDIMKETNTGSNGIMTVAGTTTPVQVQEQQVNVPLGAIPLLAQENPIEFLDQMKTITLKVPEGGYQRSTVTDATLRYNYNNGTVGAVIYTSHGHSLTIHPDPQNVTTEAHVKLQGGRSFDVCAPCGDCGAISIVLSDTQKEILNDYLTLATQKVNNGASRACQLNPGAIARVPARGFQILEADGGFDCENVATDGVGIAYFGQGTFNDEDGVTITVRFAVNGESRSVVMEHSEPDGLVQTRRLVFIDEGMFFYSGGRLDRCDSTSSGEVLWTDTTDLKTGTMGFGEGAFDFTVTEVHDGAMEFTVPERPTFAECEAVYKRNEAGTALLLAGTVQDPSHRHAKILKQVPVRFHKAAIRMSQYSDMLREIENATARSATALDRHAEGLSANDQLANQAYSSCTYANGNACVLQSGSCKFAFRGSDDANDWLSNAAGIFARATVNGKVMHGGFVHEFNKLRGWLNSRVSSCGNPHFIGHSLGGAIATVARQYYNKGTVYSFGAPQCYDHNYGCQNGGRNRYYHEEDPVAGNLFGVMSSYWHSQSSREIYKRCTRRHWWGGCRSHSWTTRSKGCTDHSGTWDTNFGAHSMNTYENYY